MRISDWSSDVCSSDLTIAVRLAGSATISGPWQKNYTRDAELGRQDTLRGRLQVEWEPTDRLTLLFSANGWRDKSDTQAGQLQGLFLQYDEAAVAAGGLFDPAETLRRLAVFRGLARKSTRLKSSHYCASRLPS